MISPARKSTPLLIALLAFLAIASARATSYYVDTAAHFNALTGYTTATGTTTASFAALYAGDRVYMKGGTNWGGLIVTLTGSMTDAQAQSNPAVIYACDSSYAPTVGGVSVADLCQISLAGTGIVFTGVNFSPSSGMYLSGTNPNNDYAGTAGYIFEMLPTSRYMTVSHCKFDNCGYSNTSANNAHYGPWIFIYGYHHTVQFCELSGRSFNPNDVNQPNKNLRTSIRDATIVIYINTSLDIDYGYHSVRYNYWGERKVPNSNADTAGQLYQPASGIVSLTGCKTTNGSTTVQCASTSGLSNSGTGIVSGWVLSGINVPSGATTVSVTDATHFVMSAPATATASSLTWTATEPFGDFALPNGWESIRVGNGSISTLSMNATVEYNVLYHSIYSANSPALPADNPGEPEIFSNKSCNNIYRYNTFLNNYGSLTLRQGDYCVAQGNYFLGGGAYDSNGNIVTTETVNDQMGGVRVIGFGNTVSNNYFYKLNGTGGICALSLYRGLNPPTIASGTTTILNNIDGLNGYETANYSQILGNTFIDCMSINLDNTASGEANAVNATQFFNNLIYYSSPVSNSTGSPATGISGGNTDALTNHAGKSSGNFVYSATVSQLGNASAMLGAGNTITTGTNPLLTGTYNVLTIPAANSPVIGKAASLPAINDTSLTGTSNNLTGNVSTYGNLDFRNFIRTGTSKDIGDYQSGLSGIGVRPLRRSEVGLVRATLPNYPIVNETFADGSRVDTSNSNAGNPPTSLNWFCSTSQSVSVSSGTMSLSASATRQAIAYFPTQTLSVGDALTLSFNFKVTSPSNVSRGLRAGLLYSGTTSRITTDSGASPANFTGTGYGSFLNPVLTSGSNPASVAKRSATAGTIMATPVGPNWLGNLAAGGATQSLVSGTTYAATLTLRKIGTDQVVVQTTCNGGTLTPVTVTGTDSSGSYNTFDTLALAVGNSAVSTIAYSNITLTKTTPLVASVGSAAAQSGVLDINLQNLVTQAGSPFTPLTFSVSSAVNGTVTLLPDGVTARFTPNNGFTGSASFLYAVTDGTNTTSSTVGLTYGNLILVPVTLSGTNQTYDGSQKTVTVTTGTYSGIPVNVTYNSGTTAPTNAGSYAVNATVYSGTYYGQTTGTLVINQAPATVTLANLSYITDGTTPRSATATTSPAGLAVSLTYSDSQGNALASAPSTAGTYTVVGTINDPNYTGSSQATLQIYGTPTASGTSLGATFGTPVTLDLLTLANDTVTTGSNLRFTTGNGANGTATINADGHTVTFTPIASGSASFTYTVTNTAPDSRTLLNYDFQEILTGSTCNDVSGYGRSGTFINLSGSGSASYTADCPTALYPQQTQSCFLYQSGSTSATKLLTGLSGTSTINLQTADWTVAGWFKRPSTSADEDIIFHLGSGNGNGSAGNELTFAFTGTSSALTLKNWNGTLNSGTTTFVNDVAISTTATSGTWHQFAIVRSGTNMNLYVDGASAGTASAFNLTFDTSSDIAFGSAVPTASTYNRAFNGSFADLAIFNAALSGSDVTKLYTAPAAYLGGLSAGNTVTFSVLPQAPVITSGTTAIGNQNVPFNYQITASNSPTSYAWSGNLPNGLSVNAGTGLISGTPTQTGIFSTTVSGSNAGGIGSAPLLVTILPPAPVITSNLNLVGITTSPLSYQITATNSPISYSASSLPPGLSVNTNTGLISGTATQTGTFSTTISGSNTGGTGSATLTTTIASSLSGLVYNYTTSGSGTWTCPAGVGSVQVECCGGGGAGGSAIRTGTGGGSIQYGGGGAGGAYARKNSFPVASGTAYSINVGAGGLAATGTLTSGSSVPGGDSWFNSSSTVLTKGGAGGACASGSTSATAFGAGGAGTAAASIGDVINAGGSGATAPSSGPLYAGAGGGSGGISTVSGSNSGISAVANSGTGAAAVTGGGNGGNPNATSSSSGPGQKPTIPPGGGGGGARASGQQAGGNGSDGQVVVTVTQLAAVSTATTVSSPPTSTLITGNSATLGGSVTGDGGATITSRGVVYSLTGTNNNPQLGGNGVTSATTSGTTGVFTVLVSGLTPASGYSFAAYATNSVGTAYTTTGTFTTLTNVDSWRQFYFGTTSSSGIYADSADYDSDGLTNLQEYTFGTNPATRNSGNLLTQTVTSGTITLTFVAQSASGTGYTSLTRHYAVQSTTDLTNSASWAAVTGYTNITPNGTQSSDIVGGGQTVTITLPVSGNKSFYRLKAWLQ